MKIRSLLTTVLALSVLALPSLGSAAHGKFRFQYTAKFTCGFNPKPVRLVPGQYTTAVGLQNPTGQKAAVRLRVALIFPPAVLAPGAVSDSIDLALNPTEALEVDCEEIPVAFFAQGTGFPPYTQGFLVIESSRRLAVAATYTVAETQQDGTLAVRSVDVEEVSRTAGTRGDD